MVSIETSKVLIGKVIVENFGGVRGAAAVDAPASVMDDDVIGEGIILLRRKAGRCACQLNTTTGNQLRTDEHISLVVNRRSNSPISHQSRPQVAGAISE